MGYTERGLDALRGKTCVTVGGRDKTARYWKVVGETQPVFRVGGRSRVREVLEGGLRGGDEGDDEDEDDVDQVSRSKGKEREKKLVEGRLECVAMIDETILISGGDSGCVFFLRCLVEIADVFCSSPSIFGQLSEFKRRW